MPKSAARQASDHEDAPKRFPPAQNRERRIQQLVAIAEELIEERILAKTASPTEVTAVLRYGSPIEVANVARVQQHTRYLQAQEEKARSETVRQEMFEKAMAAMARYSPDD